MAWINLAPLGGVIMAWGLYRLDPAGFRRLSVELVGIYAGFVPGFAAVALLPTGSPVTRLALSIAAAAIGVVFVARRHGAEVLAFFRQRATDASPPVGSPPLSAD
jgi:hypothetical protein